MLANTGGPRSSRWTLLARVITLSLPYGAQSTTTTREQEKDAFGAKTDRHESRQRIKSGVRRRDIVIAGMMPGDIASGEAPVHSDADRNQAYQWEATRDWKDLKRQEP